jgi:hypothetical protein
LVEEVVFDQREILGIPKMDDELDLCLRFGVVSLLDSRIVLDACGGVPRDPRFSWKASWVGVVIRSVFS